VTKGTFMEQIERYAAAEYNQPMQPVVAKLKELTAKFGKFAEDFRRIGILLRIAGLTGQQVGDDDMAGGLDQTACVEILEAAKFLVPGWNLFFCTLSVADCCRRFLIAVYLFFGYLFAGYLFAAYRVCPGDSRRRSPRGVYFSFGG